MANLGPVLKNCKQPKHCVPLLPGSGAQHDPPQGEGHVRAAPPHPDAGPDLLAEQRGQGEAVDSGCIGLLPGYIISCG